MARRVSHRRHSKMNFGTIIATILALSLIGGAAYYVNKNKQSFGGASDFLSIMGQVMNAPIVWARNSGAYLSSYFANAEEVRRLKNENQALLEWRNSARAIAEKLETYERLNNIKSDATSKALVGRMVAEVNGPFLRSGIVNIGSNQGVAANWVAVNQLGFIGHVVSVDKASSRVLLATDSDSRIAIMGEETRARAIMIGDKTDAPFLEHLSIPAGMKKGERILTSGDDGIIPRGIAIGIADVAPDGKWRVKLNTNAAAIDYVKLLSPNFVPAPNDKTNGLDFGMAIPSGNQASGAILPLDVGSAQLPVANTPEAIAQAQELRKVKQELAISKKQKSNLPSNAIEPVTPEPVLLKPEPAPEKTGVEKAAPKEKSPDQEPAPAAKVKSETNN